MIERNRNKPNFTGQRICCKTDTNDTKIIVTKYDICIEKQLHKHKTIKT